MRKDMHQIMFWSLKENKKQKKNLFCLEAIIRLIYWQYAALTDKIGLISSYFFGPRAPLWVDLHILSRDS